MRIRAAFFCHDRDVPLPIHQHLAASHMQCGCNKVNGAAICRVFGHSSVYWLFSLLARIDQNERMRHCSHLGSVRQKQFDYGTFGTLDFIALADNPEGNMIGLHSMK